MITLDIFRDAQAMIVAYRVSGHAGYAEEGSDIICSAVSAVTQAPVLGLEKFLKIKSSVTVEREDGVLEVALEGAPDDRTQAILQTMLYGVESIARQCPQYVRIRGHRR